MSDERISIGELEAADRAMTGKRWCVQGPWPQATVYVVDEAIDNDSLHPTHVATMAAMTDAGRSTAGDPDASGVVALRNAAPALIAIAKAALAWRDGMSDDDYKVQDAVCNALVAALKAVRP